MRIAIPARAYIDEIMPHHVGQHATQTRLTQNVVPITATHLVGELCFLFAPRGGAFHSFEMRRA